MIEIKDRPFQQRPALPVIRGNGPASTLIKMALGRMTVGILHYVSVKCLLSVGFVQINVKLLCVILLNVILLSVFPLSAILLSFIPLNVILMNVIPLNVMLLIREFY